MISHACRWLTPHTEHGITVRYPHLPVVNIGSSDRAVFVPAEVCTVVRGQPFKGPLNENQTRSMIEVACRPPADNARLITGEGCNVVGIAGGQQQQAWLVGFPCPRVMQPTAISRLMLYSIPGVIWNHSRPQYVDGRWSYPGGTLNFIPWWQGRKRKKR